MIVLFLTVTDLRISMFFVSSPDVTKFQFGSMHSVTIQKRLLKKRHKPFLKPTLYPLPPVFKAPVENFKVPKASCISRCVIQERY